MERLKTGSLFTGTGRRVTMADMRFPNSNHTLELVPINADDDVRGLIRPVFFMDFSRMRKGEIPTCSIAQIRKYLLGRRDGIVNGKKYHCLFERNYKLCYKL